MAHKIFVGSPLHNMGSSVAATFIAQGITYVGRTATLMFTDPASRLPSYLNVGTIKDPTRNITQVVELIDSKAIENSEIINYAYPFEKSVYLLNTANDGFSEHDQLQTMEYVYDRVTTDLAVCDCSDSLDSELAQKLMAEADMIMLVVDMSPKAIDWLKFWLKQPAMEANQNIMFIVNKYDEAIFALRDFAKKIGVSANRVCKIHYNPWVTKCCYTGSLQTILPLSQVLDYRVAAFKNDIFEINQAIESDILINSKRGY